MKRYICFILMLLFSCLLFAGCGNKKGSSEGGNEEGKKDSSVSTDVRIDEETGIKIAEAIEGFPVLETGHGYDMTCDGQYIYFATHSYKRGYTSAGETDGLYRAGLSFENPEIIDRDYCMGINLSEKDLYYYREGDIYDGEYGIYQADPQKLWSDKICSEDVKGQTLFVYNNEIAYLAFNRKYNTTLMFMDLSDEENVREVDIGEGEILEADVTDGKVYFVLRDNTNGHRKICVLNPETFEYKELDDTYQDILAVKDGCVYYLGAPAEADYEEGPDWNTAKPDGDRRNREYILMKSDSDGNTEDTGFKGKIGDRLIAYGDYVVYTKFVEDEPDDHGETIHGRPFLANVSTGEEWMIDRSEFKGKEIRLRDVSAGYLLQTLYIPHNTFNN